MDMLTAKEAGALLGISARMVYELFASGKLTGYRIGRAVRFDRCDIEDFRLSCRSAGTPETSAGGSSSTVTWAARDTDLAAYFQRAGVKPRLTRTTAAKARGSTPLRLVSTKAESA